MTAFHSHIKRVLLVEVDEYGQPTGNELELKGVQEIKLELVDDPPELGYICADPDVAYEITIPMNAPIPTAPLQVTWHYTPGTVAGSLPQVQPMRGAITYPQAPKITPQRGGGMIVERREPPKVVWVDCALCGVPLRYDPDAGQYVDPGMKTVCDSLLVDAGVINEPTTHSPSTLPLVEAYGLEIGILDEEDDE